MWPMPRIAASACNLSFRSFEESAPARSFGVLKMANAIFSSSRHGLLTTVDGPNGEPVRVVGMPVRFSATPGTVRSGPPGVGEHTDEVLASIGFSEDEIRSMREDGAV